MIIIYTKSGKEYKEPYVTKKQFLEITNSLSTIDNFSFDNNRLYIVNNIDKIEFKED